MEFCANATLKPQLKANSLVWWRSV